LSWSRFTSSRSTIGTRICSSETPAGHFAPSLIQSRIAARCSADNLAPPGGGIVPSSILMYNRLFSGSPAVTTLETDTLVVNRTDPKL